MSLDTLTYIGGPTALIDLEGLRLLTDPTFEPAGAVYNPTPDYLLRKTAGPAIGPTELGRVDVVLLSHDHHFDNLDGAGRALLPSVGRVLTTVAGAERLGGNAQGLAPWDTAEVPLPAGGALRITATPARHGPAGGDRGPVIGFVLQMAETPGGAVYISGDTVWYEGVEDVARRFPNVRTALLFLGAAHVAVAGPVHLTLTAAEGVEVARSFPDAAIVPLHFEGWEHFSEGRTEIAAAFAAAGLSQRLHWAPRGRPIPLPR